MHTSSALASQQQQQQSQRLKRHMSHSSSIAAPKWRFNETTVAPQSAHYSNCFGEQLLPDPNTCTTVPTNSCSISPVRRLQRSATTCQFTSIASACETTTQMYSAPYRKNANTNGFSKNCYSPQNNSNNSSSSSSSRPVSASNFDLLQPHSQYNYNTLPNRPTSMINYPMNNPNYIPFVNNALSYNNSHRTNGGGSYSNTLTRHNHQSHHHQQGSYVYYRDQSDCVNVNNMQTPPVNSNLNNSSNVTCQVTPAGYVSEGGEASVVAPPPPARAALSPATVAPLRYHQHSQQLQQPQTTRVFKDGISAIRDCLQRSDIQLADSDR